MEISQINVQQIGLNSASPSSEDYLAVGKELFKAFESTGFAYIQNHGVNQELINQSMVCSKKFFQLPEDEKNKHERNETIQQGYVEPGREIFTDTTKDVKRTRESKKFLVP